MAREMDHLFYQKCGEELLLHPHLDYDPLGRFGKIGSCHRLDKTPIELKLDWEAVSDQRSAISKRRSKDGFISYPWVFYKSCSKKDITDCSLLNAENYYLSVFAHSG